MSRWKYFMSRKNRRKLRKYKYEKFPLVEGKLTNEGYKYDVTNFLHEKDYIDTIKRMNDDLICCKIKINEKDIDRFKDKMLKWYQRIYKKLFPTRFRINRKVKEYMIRWRMRHFVEKVDQYIAWGDDIRK